MGDMIEVIAAFTKSFLVEERDQTLRKMLSKYLRGRPVDRRSAGIHVTQLVDPCPRRLAWAVSNPEIQDKRPAPALQKIFDIGKITDDWFQNVYWGPMGLLWGDWRCSSCGVEKKKQFMPKDPCTVMHTLFDREFVCGEDCAGTWAYIEPFVVIKIDEQMVVGNCDGILVLNDRRYVWECKTERPDAWKERTKAKPKDVMQASIYAWLLGIEWIINTYVEKSTWDQKDYVRKIDPDRTRAWVEENVRSAIRDARLTRHLELPRKCASKTASRAQRCGARDLCF